jgi:hypothetical protein
LIVAIPVAVTSPRVAAAAASRVHPDFNGDGYADLPIPVPGENLKGADNAGALHVLYGSAGGPRAKGSQFLNQATPGVIGSPKSWEIFGLDWSAGDFDDDGYDDMAVGIIGDRIGGHNRGGVQVFFGSASGLTTTGSMLLNEALPGFPGAPQSGDTFGFAVEAGDFDGDGHDDLAVGNPGEAWGGGDEYGTVYVFSGRSSGLSTTGIRRFNQTTAGIAGAPGDGDRFGLALAVGDFDKDGHDDLAIGAPGETIGSHSDAGVVHVLYGSVSGLRTAGDDLWSQAVPDVPGSVGTGDKFGASLATGRLDADNRDDLAIGAFGDAVGAVADAGSIVVLRGRSGGLTSAGARRLSYATSGVKGHAVGGDLFGMALASDDFDGDGHGDLAVAAPGRTVSGRSGAGEVVVFRGAVSSRPLAGPSRRLNEHSDGVGGEPQNGDFFGTQVTATDFDGDGRGDLCVGAAGEDFSGVVDGGVAYVMYGRASGLGGRGSRAFSQDSAWMPNHAENHDVFGNQALA